MYGVIDSGWTLTEDEKATLVAERRCVLYEDLKQVVWDFKEKVDGWKHECSVHEKTIRNLYKRAENVFGWSKCYSSQCGHFTIDREASLKNGELYSEDGEWCAYCKKRMGIILSRDFPIGIGTSVNLNDSINRMKELEKMIEKAEENYMDEIRGMLDACGLR